MTTQEEPPVRENIRAGPGSLNGAPASSKCPYSLNTEYMSSPKSARL